jgi:hypothetical protein
MYPVTVQFLRAQQTGIGFKPGQFYTAYGVSVGGKVVASLAVRSDYRRDNAIALVMGIAAAIAGAARARSARLLHVALAAEGQPAGDHGKAGHDHHHDQEAVLGFRQRDPPTFMPSRPAMMLIGSANTVTTVSTNRLWLLASLASAAISS